MIALCTVAANHAHLIEFPLEQAQVPYKLHLGNGMYLIVRVAEADVDRAQAALERFGTFRGVDR